MGAILAVAKRQTKYEREKKQNAKNIMNNKIYQGTP